MLNVVTGKIGSGKSQVMKILEDKGFTCLRLDDYAKDLRKEPEAYKAIVSIFGSACLDCLGYISPFFLRKAFMSEEPAMVKAFAEYEHYIAMRCYKRIARLDLEVAPVFVEVGWIKKFFDYCTMSKLGFNNLLLVTARDDIRNSRLLSRGASKEMIDCTNKKQDWAFGSCVPFKACELIDNSGSISELFDSVQKALVKCKFSPEEKNAVFLSLYEKSPDFVKPNVQCYMYYNMGGCANCPFPCARSDKNFEEAKKNFLEKQQIEGV